MKTITLCGSTRFKETFKKVEVALTRSGYAVYSCAEFGHADGQDIDEEGKLILDAVHCVKIANSKAIFVVNVGGYIGESTRREIYYAQAMGVTVHFLETANGTTLRNLNKTVWQAATGS